MKRFLSFALCVALFLTGCASVNSDIRRPVNFYYRTRELHYNSAEGVISAESRESFGHEEDYTYLVEQYLLGPTSENCISPFPAGTTLAQLDFLKDKVLIELSSHISLLSGSELTIACTCLARTLLEMTDMKEVKISSKDDLLDGMEYVTISRDDFALTDSFALPQDFD